LRLFALNGTFFCDFYKKAIHLISFYSIILAEEWMQDYNYSRPHEALGGKTPMEYRALPAACCY